MKKTAVIYWSGTGNTKQMAEAVLEGMKSAGAEAALLEAAQVDASTFSGVDAVAFRCPAMGSEVLEEMEFENGKYIYLPYYKVTIDNAEEFLNKAGK